MNNRIYLIAGPCAVESEEQIMGSGYKGSLIKDIVQPYRILFGLRGGVWKPRTRYRHDNGDKVFEGTREEGLEWLGKTATSCGLFIATECMSENDLRHFGHYLEPERDFIQIGARNSQNFALLYAVGATPFNVLLKNPQHGVDLNEAVGSLQRFEKNRTKVYCVRGEKKFIHPDGIPSEAHQRYMTELLNNPNQHPDARNLNNIGAINQLRQHPYFTENDILSFYDPSHVWGGKTDLMRRKIGEYAIKAITEYGYDGIIVEVYDRSAHAICDAAQALLTTTNGIDWSETYVGKEPEILPITLVDIVCELIRFQAGRLGIPETRLVADTKRLREEIRWDVTDDKM